MYRLLGFSGLVFDIAHVSSITSMDLVYSGQSIGQNLLHLISYSNPRETSLSELESSCLSLIYNYKIKGIFGHAKKGKTANAYSYFYVWHG